MASWLSRFGHDVRVLTVRRPLAPAGGTTNDLPDRQIARTSWAGESLLRAWKATANADRQLGRAPGSAYESRGAKSRGEICRTMRDWFRTTVYAPDPFVGWIPYAVAMARDLTRGWHPDVVYSSSPPNTSALVGRIVSFMCRAPHVAEFRDLWTDNPYRHVARWAIPLDAHLERTVLDRCSGIVAVTPPRAETLRNRYPQVPVHVVYNGFDPDDYPSARQLPAPTSPRELHLVHTGTLLNGRRDARPLLEAVARMTNRECHLRLDMYGDDTPEVRDAVATSCPSAAVVIHRKVTRTEALSAMTAADVLVAIMWNDVRGAPDIPGKVFEYIGAGRPILVIGPPGNEAQKLVERTGLGRGAASVTEIVDFLDRLCLEKQQKGQLRTDPAVAQAFTREQQAKELASFLETVTGR